MGVRVREQPKGSKVYWLFVNHNGKRKAKKIGDRKTALAMARQVEQRLAAQDLGILKEEKHVPLFKDYADQWYNGYAKATLKYSTWRGYDYQLRSYLNPFFGSKKLDSVDRTTIKKFIFKLQDGTLAPATVKRIHSTLSGILSSAFEDGLIPGNPAARMGKLIKKRDLCKKIDPLTKEEVLLFLETARQHYQRYYPVFLLAVSTGMRLGEVIGLEPGDIDFNGRFIEVRRSIVKGRRETPKNGKSRRVDMSLDLADALKQQIRKRSQDTLKNGWSEPPRTLFYSEAGTPLDTNNLVKRQFHGCLKKAGLRQVRFHDQRHSFASIHIQQGESLAYVRDQLGHHSIQLTVDIYGHLVPGANKAAADRLLSPLQSATQAQPVAATA